MDFYITKEEIVKSLNSTLGVVEKRQTLPILANVLFEVDESSLKLTATDLESEISTISTISNYKSGGKITAPAKKLSELCRLFKDDSEIHFFLDGDNLKIETSSGKYNLATLPSEDFPVFEKEEGGNTVNIKSKIINWKNFICNGKPRLEALLKRFIFIRRRYKNNKRCYRRPQVSHGHP
jgi:DNA polymerase-3 subunit beta